MRVLIVTTLVPFVRGGAELLAEGLRDALLAAGHQAEIVAIPFKWYPSERILENMLACRLLDLTESAGTPVDRVIGLKFPAYLVSHPCKVLWLLHQHRQAYDLWEHAMADLHHYNDGRQIRDAIHQADARAMREAAAVYTIADNVSRRLLNSIGIQPTTLYHPPPGADQFYCDQAEDYLFFPSRLTPVKRQALVLEAMAHTRQAVRVCFVGSADHPPYAEGLQALAAKLDIDRRVRWLGPATDQEKIQLYARALGVVYPPVDEDYGYVTLEAMLSAKPVLTCTDSGGPLEFVRHGVTGLIAEPTPVALAEALDRVWENREQARSWGAQGKAEYQGRAITWTRVVERLLA